MVIELLDKFKEKQFKKEWYYTYWAFDLHNTILKSKYKLGDFKLDFYKNADIVLQFLTKRDDVKLILFTSSYPNQIKEYIKQFEKYEIKFDYINENPEISSDQGHFGYYKDKFYFDLLFDDKAGFNPIIDWELINIWLKNYPEPNPGWTPKF